MIVTISVFFPEGFALAFVLLFGPRVVWGIFAGQFFLALAQDFSFIPAMLIAAGNSLEALLAYYLFRKLKFDTHLQHIRDIYLFIGVVVFILQPFSALMGTIVLLLYKVISFYEISTIFFSWWFGNLMGQLLLTPLLLYLYHLRYQIHLWKMVFVSLFFGIVCYIFIYIIPVENGSILFGITIVPLVMLLSYRNGNVYALSAIVMITLIAIYTSNHNIGPFSIYDERTNLINLNFYILAHILTILIMGVLFIEKNKALNELAILNTVLEQRVQEEVYKNREKERLMFLQGRLIHMGEMIALIVHQWKQPLNNLSLITQSFYLKYQKKGLDDQSTKKFFIDSKKQIDEMQKITDDFKEFFKPERKEQKICIRETISHILELIQPALEHNDIILERDCPDNIHVMGYANEFAQSVMNIINNAKDALQTAEVFPKKITIKLEEQEAYIILTIQDNAGGIPHEDINRIFDPYFSTKPEKEGMGLGLYISKMVIEEYMGGKITVSNDDKGAVFEIVFTKQT